MENKREILRVVDLEKKFHKLEVLKGINVSFHENEVVSIIGPSGGGKSTFLRCLNLLEQPTSGQILFDGTDICSIKGKAIDQCRQRMGMVFHAVQPVQQHGRYAQPDRRPHPHQGHESGGGAG